MRTQALQLVYREFCRTPSALIDFFANLTSNIELHYCSTLWTSPSSTTCSRLRLYKRSSSSAAHIHVYMLKFDHINLNRFLMDVSYILYIFLFSVVTVM